MYYARQTRKTHSALHRMWTIISLAAALVCLPTHHASAQESNTRKYNIPGFGTAEVTHNADGTTNWDIKTRCSFCSSRGICSSCFGRGGKMIGVAYPMWSTCYTCGSSGKCRHCNGSGQTIIQCFFDKHGTGYMVNPVTLQMQIIDGSAFGLTPEVRERERQSYESSSNTPTRRQCSFCYGSGRVKQELATSFPNDK